MIEQSSSKNPVFNVQFLLQKNTGRVDATSLKPRLYHKKTILFIKKTHFIFVFSQKNRLAYPFQVVCLFSVYHKLIGVL